MFKTGNTNCFFRAEILHRYHCQMAYMSHGAFQEDVKVTVDIYRTGTNIRGQQVHDTMKSVW